MPAAEAEVKSVGPQDEKNMTLLLQEHGYSGRHKATFHHVQVVTLNADH